MKILVTGAAGFIGFHLVRKLIGEGYEVVGIDCINDYYDINLKYSRLRECGIEKEYVESSIPVNSTIYPNYKFFKMKLEDHPALDELFRCEKFDYVCNLAAQAGVRYSLTHPRVYVESNMLGFLNILEACRTYTIKHLVYASSSSVYGLNSKMPFSTSDNIDHPISLYAASKKSNELMAHTYSHLFNVPTTGLRFFSVYGPWGRPDMALFIFTKAILEGNSINVFNNGNMRRDFTYVDDIVEGVSRIIQRIPEADPEWTGSNPNPSSSVAPYRIFNIGNNAPVKLMDFIDMIEAELGMKAKKNFMPMQQGDVPASWANVTDLMEYIDYKPQTDITKGVKNFIQWYKVYYGIV